MDVTIYHNPRCGTSRNTLALLRHAGITPRVIDYLATPPNAAELAAMIGAAGLSVRAAMREKDAAYVDAKLDQADDNVLIAAMLAHPQLINRPFVVTPLGTRLCRPCEVVLQILPRPLHGPFHKEDGTLVIDQHGQAVLG